MSIFFAFIKDLQDILFLIKNYKEELLNSIIRIEVEEELRNIYKFKHIFIQDNHIEITNIKKVDRFYDF